LEDRPARIKKQLLGYDECDIEALLDALVAHDFIQRYAAGDARYIQVVNFDKHQHPHIKEGASAIPAPDEHGASMVQVPDEHGSSPADSLFLDSGLPDSPSPIPDTRRTPVRRAAVPPNAREPDAIWDVTEELFGPPANKNERGRRNGVVGLLRETGAGPEEIRKRAKHYAVMWPDITLTDTALANNWSTIGNDLAKRALSPPGAKSGDDVGSPAWRERQLRYFPKQELTTDQRDTPALVPAGVAARQLRTEQG
jgi:hypothetical protein